jgi:hypothetical protein
MRSLLRIGMEVYRRRRRRDMSGRRSRSAASAKLTARKRVSLFWRKTPLVAAAAPARRRALEGIWKMEGSSINGAHLQQQQSAPSSDGCARNLVEEEEKELYSAQRRRGLRTEDTGRKAEAATVLLLHSLPALPLFMEGQC